MQTIEFLKDELWYGGVIFHADRYPISSKDEYTFDMGVNRSCNQFNPVFISNKGRYLWCGDGGEIRFVKGIIYVYSDTIKLESSGTTLKEASLAAAKKYYPATGTTPDKRAFLAPQYCSWVVLLWSQNQEGILNYARSIIEKGYKPGLFIIDDTWQKDYGVWEFNKDNFPDPDAMMKELNDMGFLVSMWFCPYISPDSPAINEAFPGTFEHMQKKRLIMDGERPRIVYWWEGYSAMLDFKERSAVEWINARTKYLEEKYGVAGFKLDGGDPIYTGLDYADATKQSTLYIDSIQNSFKEARSCYKLAGKPIIQRLNDKAHMWESKLDEDLLGLSSLLPGIMTQGLVGYYYGCPDMVGGGMSADFIDKSNLDAELIIRWCQASILMPMVQFSYDVWNHKENHIAEYCGKALALREKLLPYIVEMIERASITNEPVIRYMEYQFPEKCFSGMKDQFMLGDKYLVAPVLEKGARERKIVFPDGQWKDIENGNIYNGGECMVEVPLDKLSVFEIIDK